jgi:hypothetical protein
MFLGFADTVTKNMNFSSAYGRTLKERQAIQSQLEAVEVDGRFNTLWFVITDSPSDYFEVNHNADDSLYQVFVGYELDGDYQGERDKEVICLIGGWLKRVFQETSGYAARRAELLEMIRNWEDKALAV